MAASAGHATAAAASGIWEGQRRFLTLGLLLVVASTAFDALAVATALPVTARDLGGLALYGWAFSAFALTDLIGIVVAGAEADRYGPVYPFASGAVLFVAGLLVAGSAPTMAVVILGRAIQGLGSGCLNSVAYVAVGRGYAEGDKPRMLALLATAWVVPGLLGPGVGGLVAEHIGWRWIFWGLAAFVALASASAILPMHGIAAAERSAPRDWRRIGAAVALAIGVMALQAAPDLRARWLLVAALAAGGALVAATLPRMVPRGTWRATPGLPAVVALSGLLNLAFFGVDSFVPLLLTAVRGQTATFAGLALTASTVCWSAGAWVQERTVRRFSQHAVAWAGLGLIAVGMCLMALTLVPPVPVWCAIPAWGLGGFGIGMTYTTLTLAMLRVAPAGGEGAATSATQLAAMLGFAAGTGIGGLFIAGAHAHVAALRTGLALQITLMLGGVALATLAARNLPGGRDGPTP